MPSSTTVSRSWAVIGLAAVLAWLPIFAGASTSDMLVAPFSNEVPNIGRAMAQLVAGEISASGYLQAIGGEQAAALLAQAGVQPEDMPSLSPQQVAGLSDVAGYVLVGDVVSFTIAGRDQPMDLGADFNDLSRLLGKGDQVAQVVLDVRLLRTGDGAEVGQWLVEGQESRRGTRLDSVTTGWAGSIDLQSAEFRESMLGLAAYKAIGELLKQLYTVFPLEGTVLAVSGDAVVIDLDDTNGLLVGDEISIIRQSGVLSSTGETVWDSELRVGSVQVVEFQPGRCLCLVLDGAGLILEGDIARPLLTRYTLPSEADLP